MRRTVHLPLELLTSETPVLGEERRSKLGSGLKHVTQCRPNVPCTPMSLIWSRLPAPAQSDPRIVELS